MTITEIDIDDISPQDRAWARRDEDVEDGITVCSACNTECRVIEMDFGIGYTECWGAGGFDSRIERVSNCCEAGWEVL